MRWICLLALAALSSPAGDISSIKSEPNAKKRAKRAFDFANSSLVEARSAYSASDYRKALAEVRQVDEAISLGFASLQSTGKAPRKSRAYKRAELRLRELIRHMDDFAREAALDDRASIEAVAHHAQQVHDEILTGIMEKK